MRCLIKPKEISFSNAERFGDSFQDMVKDDEQRIAFEILSIIK